MFEGQGQKSKFTLLRVIFDADARYGVTYFGCLSSSGAANVVGATSSDGFLLYLPDAVRVKQALKGISNSLLLGNLIRRLV